MVARSRMRRQVSMKAMIGAVSSPNTPARLKEGLVKKYPQLEQYK